MLFHTFPFKRANQRGAITLSEHKRLEAITPKIRDIDKNPQLKADYKLWSTSRSDFLNRMAARDQATIEEGWQKHYMRGEKPSGQAAETSHQTKRRLQGPVREG